LNVRRGGLAHQPNGFLHASGPGIAVAYPVAAAELAGAAPPVVGVRVAGLAVPGALVEVSAVAAVTS